MEMAPLFKNIAKSFALICIGNQANIITIYKFLQQCALDNLHVLYHQIVMQNTKD